MLLLDSSPREGTETPIGFFTHLIIRHADCWTLHPERGAETRWRCSNWKGRRIVGLFTPKRSRISTAAPSRNFYSTSGSCRTTVRRRPRGSCRGAPCIRGNDSRFHLSPAVGANVNCLKMPHAHRRRDSLNRRASVPIYRWPCYTAEAIIPMSWL